MSDKITYPFSWLAGQQAEPEKVIQDLGIEMMSHRSDLLGQAERHPDQRDTLVSQANLLEKYAIITTVIAYQMAPDKWDPRSCAGLLDLAQKHIISVPEWMTCTK